MVRGSLASEAQHLCRDSMPLQEPARPTGVNNEASASEEQQLTRFSCGVADIIANDQTLLSVEKTLKQAPNSQPETLFA